MSESGDQSDGDAAGTVNSITFPYEDEPLADVGDVGAENNENQEEDEDRLSLDTIERRYERIEDVGKWYVFYCLELYGKSILFSVRYGGSVTKGSVPQSIGKPKNENTTHFCWHLHSIFRI